jgi:hypothetical protein
MGHPTTSSPSTLSWIGGANGLPFGSVKIKPQRRRLQTVFFSAGYRRPKLHSEIHYLREEPRIPFVKTLFERAGDVAAFGEEMNGQALLLIEKHRAAVCGAPFRTKYCCAASADNILNRYFKIRFSLLQMAMKTILAPFLNVKGTSKLIDFLKNPPSRKVFVVNYERNACEIDYGVARGYFLQSSFPPIYWVRMTFDPSEKPVNVLAVSRSVCC